MAMSKKDFEELAQLLREFYTTKYGMDNVRLQDSIEEFCARRNPRFNRTKFRRACFGPDLTSPKTP